MTSDTEPARNDKTLADAPFLPPSFAQHVQTPLPEFLYHYTNQTGLVGIANNSELWATKINYMNDSTEFYTALQMAEEHLTTREFDPKDTFSPLATLTLRKRTAINIWKVFERISSGGNIGVICFCIQDDLLSQWRGYAAGSVGFSIGFNSVLLKAYASKADFTLAKCVYDKETQAQIVAEICDYYLQESIINSYGLGDIIKGFARSLRECGAFFKSSSFAEEKEWRLVSSPIPVNQLRFRVGKSFITPYGVLDIGKSENSCLANVRVGPCPHMDLSVSSVGLLLLRNGISPRVSPSSVPFRDW